MDDRRDDPADDEPQHEGGGGREQPGEHPADRGDARHRRLEVVHDPVGLGETEVMGAGQQDVTAHPEHRDHAHVADRGHDLRHRPHQTVPEPLLELRVAVGRHREAHVVHLHQEADGSVHHSGDPDGDHDEHGGARPQRLRVDRVHGDDHDLRGEDQIRAHRARDDPVLGLRASGGGRCLLGPSAHQLPDLLGALEAQVQAAEHEDRRQRPGRENAQQQQDGQDEDQLVAQRALGDPPDDRQLARGLEPLHVLRRDRGVVDHHPHRLGTRLRGRGRHVVGAGRGQAGEGRHVIEQCGESTGHAEVPSPGQRSLGRRPGPG